VQFREALEKDGFGPDVIGSVHMPVGLEIGAETVEEIAVAIVAELIRERRGAR
jgi:xanthine dehydrogenase accessory factor